MPNDTKKRILIEIIAVLILIFLIILLWVSSSAAAPKRRDVQQGNAFYKEGDYVASAQKYAEALEKDPESDIIHFNMGTALYKKKDYEGAVENLQKALLSDNKDLKGKAHYNLGNTLYQYGINRENQDISLAVSSLEKSLSQYERALSIESDDKDAQFNYAYVKKELERLKEKQQQRAPQKQDQESQQQPPKQDEQMQENNQQRQQPSPPGQEQQQTEADQGQSQSPQETSQEGSDVSKESPQDQEKEQQEDMQNQQKQAGRGSSTPSDIRELTKQEAEMLLNDYTQTEEPQGLLNVQHRHGDIRHPLKDW